jgi:hypothetical protein
VMLQCRLGYQHSFEWWVWATLRRLTWAFAKRFKVKCTKIYRCKHTTLDLLGNNNRGAPVRYSRRYMWCALICLLLRPETGELGWNVGLRASWSCAHRGSQDSHQPDPPNLRGVCAGWQKLYMVCTVANWRPPLIIKMAESLA